MDPELSQELSEIAQAIRAQLEWHQACGSSGVPRSSPADLARLAPEGPEPARELAAPAPSAVAVAAAGAPSPPARVAPVELPGASAPVDAEERLRRLAVLADDARACTRCVLHVERKQAVFARGTGSSGLCFVGEGPGADEDLQGYPFVGAAGQLLDRMIEAMGIGRDEVYVCNIVKCRPPKNRKPEPEEMAACVPYLEEQVTLIAPQVIVALGATAVQGLLGTSEGITRLRGKWKLYKGRIPVMPTFHPAYLLRTPGAKREVWDDLQAVLRQMGRAIPERRR
ncbi:MAG TPA: uracil-DNA glycosylase [Polyangiaceae bacterium]|jgi:DNA polymerase|nr:uracil-DNA glycosylase [Polyangiaceae bacterium]